jgi:ABC-type multidrug transport system ATPase subunit
VYAVEVEGLTKRFGAMDALRGIDLTVEPATVLGLLGPNGAGKSTTIKILSTLLAPDGGRALVDGLDVTTRPRQVRSRIGVTGQRSAVDERLTGRENPSTSRASATWVATADGSARSSCWRSSTWSTRPTGRPRPTRAGCGAGSTSP